VRSATTPMASAVNHAPRRIPGSVALGSQVVTADKSGTLVGKVFKILGETTVGIGANTVVGGALGGVLQLVQGIGIPVPKSDLEQVQEELRALAAQLTQLHEQVGRLEGRVEFTHASQLLHSSDATTSVIEAAMNKLTFMANNPTDKSPQLVVELADDVKKLGSAPEYFERFLNSKLADNPIKATSRALAVSSRFFDQRQSDQVKAVFDYYATYEAELAIVLTNYWNANPTGHSVTYRKERIEKIEDSVNRTEKDSVKPAVPAGAFIDTKTPRLMWGTENQTADAVAVVEQDLQTRKDLRLFGFDNWQVPSFPDYNNLIAGAKGNPRAWLQSEVKVPLSNQLLWGSSSVTKHPPLGGGVFKHRFKRVQVRVFDLNTGKEEQFGQGQGNSSWETTTSCNDLKKCLGDTSNSEFRDLKRFLQGKRAGLLLLRHLAPGEHYWYGAA
jgi:hypothetical protein